MRSQLKGCFPEAPGVVKLSGSCLKISSRSIMEEISSGLPSKSSAEAGHGTDTSFAFFDGVSVSFFLRRFARRTSSKVVVISTESPRRPVRREWGDSPSLD